VKAIALGTAGLPGFISINPVHAGWLHYFVGMTISFIIAITVTLILSKRKANKEVVE
ncbi:PTS maltose transporter subunit IIBC, partial [Escherichia coli]|nr:PTS maltose transporter subunit IIBC [Escherichia coli]